MTYAELLERTGKLAGHLADHGIAANDTVAIMLPNAVPWAESCLARATVPAESNSRVRRSPRTAIAFTPFDPSTAPSPPRPAA